MTKTKLSLYNYSSDHIEFRLKDHLNRVISLDENDSVYLNMKRTRGSSTLLFNSQGTIYDSTQGHIGFDLTVEDMSHSAGEVVLEIRVSNTSGVERVAGQIEASLIQSIGTSGV